MDGWITIGTKLDTNKFDKQIEELESKIKQEEQKQELSIEVGSRLEQDMAKASREVANLTKQYKDAATQADFLAEKVQKYTASFGHVKGGDYFIQEAKAEYEAQAAVVDSINAKLEKAEETESRIAEKIAKNNLQYQTSVDKVAALNGRIELTNLKAQDLQMKAQETNYRETQKGLQNVQRQVSQATKQTAGMKKEVNNVSKGVQDIQKNFTGAIHKVGKLALAVLSIRSAYALVRQAASTLGQYDKQYATDLEYMRFVIAQGIAPILRKVVELAQTLMAYINYLAQKLFGVNIFANATASAFKSAKDSMSGMAKSSQEIKNNLAAFDEINVLAQETGGEGTLLPSMDIGGLEDVEIPPWLEKLGKILEPIGQKFREWGEKLGGVKNLFKELQEQSNNFLEGFKRGAGNLDTSKLRESIKGIGDSIKRIANDPEVQSAAKRMVDKLSTNMGRVVGSASRIGNLIATDLFGGIQRYLEEHEIDIKN